MANLALIGRIANSRRMKLRHRTKREWVITPHSVGLVNVWRDLRRSWGLLGFVAVHTILQVYRKAVLGAAWLVIRPLVAVIAAILVVGSVLGISTAPVPLLLFTTVGIALWTLFKAGLKHGTRAMRRSRRLTNRVAIPRVLIVVGSLGPALVEFAVVFVGALVVLAYFTYTGQFVPTPGLRVLAIIPVLIFVMALVVAVSCVTGVLKTMASDIALALNYVTSLLLVVTPVVYPMSIVPQSSQWLMLLNPLSPAMELWRSALLGTPAPPWWSVALAGVMTTLLLVSSLNFLSRWEQKVIDQS